jgi:hypothetical protein
MRAARLYALLTIVTLLLGGAYQFFRMESGVPTHWPSAMRFATGCVTAAGPLRQTFRVTTGAIAGITLLPSIRSGTAGQMLIEVRDDPAAGATTGAVRYATAIPLADLTDGVAYTVRTPPIPSPADGRMLISIGRSEDSGCLAFQASARPAADAGLTLANRELFGDLLFQVHADRGTPLHGVQRWFASATHVTPPLAVIAALALFYGIAIAGLAWLLIVERDEPPVPAEGANAAPARTEG